MNKKRICSVVIKVEIAVQERCWVLGWFHSARKFGGKERRSVGSGVDWDSDCWYGNGNSTIVVSFS